MTSLSCRALFSLPVVGPSRWDPRSSSSNSTLWSAFKKFNKTRLIQARLKEALYRLGYHSISLTSERKEVLFANGGSGGRLPETRLVRDFFEGPSSAHHFVHRVLDFVSFENVLAAAFRPVNPVASFQARRRVKESCTCKSLRQTLNFESAIIQSISAIEKALHAPAQSARRHHVAAW